MCDLSTGVPWLQALLLNIAALAATLFNSRLP
jgi:hypothetical protein